MNRFGLFQSDDDTNFPCAKPKKVATVANNSGFGPIRRKLNFDDEAPSAHAVVPMPDKFLSNAFLSRDKKVASEPTPIKKVEAVKFKLKSFLSNVESTTSTATSSPAMDNSSFKLQFSGMMQPLRSAKSVQLQKDSPDIRGQNGNFYSVLRHSQTTSDSFTQFSQKTTSDTHSDTFSECLEKSKQTKGTKLEDALDISDTSSQMSLSMSKNMRDPDLNTISPETVAKQIRENHTSKYLIVDCRYEYEYQGGHIEGAINLLNPETLEKLFFTYRSLLFNPQYIEDLKKDFTSTLSKAEFYLNSPSQQETSTSQPPLIIFHCEFSQKRGPRGFRALRKKDREVNEFPKLNYPEIYLLEGGYCNFFSQYPELCEGRKYIRMVDKEYKMQYSEAKISEKKAWSNKSFVEADSIVEADTTPENVDQ